MYHLSDIFIGDHPIKEYFGSHPDIYSARYNLQGYPGIRIQMPSLTPILAGADGFVLETGFEEAGKGKFITLVHEGYLSTYGHLNDILVQKDEKVIAGQLIAHSNQSGMAEFPCLYFGIAPCDGAGTKTLQNGFGGYIDPLGSEVKWEVKGLKEPLTEKEETDKMALSSREYSILNAQSANYRVILNFLKQHTGLDDFLKKEGRVPLNLETTPDDSSGGESISSYLGALAEEFRRMHDELVKQEQTPSPSPYPDEITIQKKPLAKSSFMLQLKEKMRSFVFSRGGK